MRRPVKMVVLSTGDRELSRFGVAANCRAIASPDPTGDLAQPLGVQDQPVLLIIDVGDDPEGAIDHIKRFKERCPSARVATLADEYHRNDLVSAYQAGANACFVKFMSCGSFLRALETIMLGETILPPELLPFIGDPGDQHEKPPADANGALPSANQSTIRLDAVPRLSAREKCILRCVIDGDSNKTIARKIDIAEATVKVHVKAILRKTRLSNRTQAAIWAMNHSSLIWASNDRVNKRRVISRITQSPAPRLGNGTSDRLV